MADVFISYRHVEPDQSLASGIAACLTQRQISHFIDSGLRIGQDWVDVICSELAECRALIVLLSAESIRSDMVRYEVSLAHRRRKRILPVRVDYDGALPYDLGAYLDKIQYRLWRPGEPTEVTCAAIIEALTDAPADTGLDPSEEALRRLGEITELRGAPLPSADPRVETGGLKLDSPFYVRRVADGAAEALVAQAGETILIKGARQVGKTSLAARLRAHAERRGQQTCYIDLQLPDESRLRDLGTLFRYLAGRIAKDLHTAIKPGDVWDDAVGDADSLADFLSHGVLADVDETKPVLLCLDEVDNIFKYGYRDGFFATLRAWHNRRATHPLWNRLNLLIAHSTEPALFIKDLNQSPFNVGTRIRLGDFTRDEVLWLNLAHGAPVKTAADLDRLMRLIGGHPYLIRQALYILHTDAMSVATLEKLAPDDRGPFGDHLRRNLWVLRENEQLQKTLRTIVRGGICTSEDEFQRLRAAGLVEGESRTSAALRCDLYRVYFKEHL